MFKLKIHTCLAVNYKANNATPKPTSCSEISRDFMLFPTTFSSSSNSRILLQFNDTSIVEKYSNFLTTTELELTGISTTHWLTLIFNVFVVILQVNPVKFKLYLIP